MVDNTIQTRNKEALSPQEHSFRKIFHDQQTKLELEHRRGKKEVTLCLSFQFWDVPFRECRVK